jgi:hypothetical protein
MAMRTGLRRNELKCLRWSDLHLDDETPHIRLRATTTKSRRADTVPLSVDVVEELRDLRPDSCDPKTPVFPKVPKMATFKSDLERAGIPYEDELGRRLDFHALRVTFGTMLATSGTALRTAMELMRHTDARLTTRIYTDPRLLDTAAAIKGLPQIPQSPDADVIPSTKPVTKTPEKSKARKVEEDPVSWPSEAESLPSGLPSSLPFCLPEPVTPNDNRLAPNGAEDRILERIIQAINSVRKKTCGTDKHSMTPTDIDLTEDEEKHGKLEAGGIEPPSRSISAWASTCIVGLFQLIRLGRAADSASTSHAPLYLAPEPAGPQTPAPAR